MTFRINSAYNLNYWAGSYNNPYRNEFSSSEDSNNISIWGDNYLFGEQLNSFPDLTNNYLMSNEDPIAGRIPGMKGLNYIQPGASFAPMDGIMTAPFGANDNLFGSGQYNSNPFATTMFINGMTAGNNIFKNTNINANQFNSLKLSNTSIRAGNFGSQTINGHITNISTPSGNFNFNDIDAGNFYSSNANLIGNINSYKQTNTLINSPTENLNKISQVIDTPTETITRTVTRGTIWV